MAMAATPKSGAAPAPASLAVECCGVCKFGQGIPEDLTLTECFGGPPTPVIAGMTPQGPQIVLIRARLPRSHRPCALFQRKPAFLAG
jgi:hypothetical protein